MNTNRKYRECAVKKGHFLKIHTVFASTQSVQIVKSGILLIELKPLSVQQHGLRASVMVTFEDRNESEFVNEKAVEFGDGEYFQSAAIRKAILLTKYAQILMQWIRSDESANAQSEHREQREQQQQRRRPLFVNDRYRLIFGRFLEYFESEMEHCDDAEELQRERRVLHKLTTWNNPESDT